MRLLLVTDHRFIKYQNKVYDVFHIDQDFFEDYEYIFEKVSILARLVPIGKLPDGALRSDSEGVSFIPGVYPFNRFLWFITCKILNIKLIRKEVSLSDAIIVRVPTQLGTLAAIEAAKQNKPVLVEVVGDPDKSYRYQGKNPLYNILADWQTIQLRKVINTASAVSYVSKFYLQTKYPVKPGIYTDNISSIRLDESDITHPREYLVTPLPWKIIYVANFIPYKRHEDLIKVCGKLIQDGYDLELHLVGDGMTTEKSMNLSSELNLTDHIYFHGHISEKEKIYSLLDDCDLFVIPSASEGVPRAVLEAMARGLPVLGSEVGGIPEIVRDMDLFQVGDIEGIYNQINGLFSNPNQLSEMSRFSIKTVRDYSSEVLSEKRRILYRHFRDIIQSS